MGRDTDTLVIGKNFNPTNKGAYSTITDLSVAGGYGTDTITINSGVTVTGSVRGGAYPYIDDTSDTDTADILTINGTGSITGNVLMGAGNDTLNLSSTGSIGGYVQFE